MTSTPRMMHAIVYLLVCIGAMNWGLIGLFDLNILNVALSTIPSIERLFYVAIGIAGIALVLESTEHRE